MIHDLKITNERFHNVFIGKKKVEIRDNDRDYQRGDKIRFLDINGGHRLPNDHWVITHIHSGLGMADGYVALSIEKGEEK